MSPTETALVLLAVAGVPMTFVSFLAWHQSQRVSRPTGDDPGRIEVSEVINGHAQIPREGWRVETRTRGGRRLVVAHNPRVDAWYLRLEGAPPGLTLRAQDGLDRTLDSAAYQERIGDVWVDDHLLIRGDLDRLRPRMTAEARAALVELLGPGYLVTGGEVVAWRFGRRGRFDQEPVIERMEHILETLRLPEGGAHARLEDMARTDSVPALRVDALRQLHREGAPAARAVAEALLADADAGVAVRAALLLGPERDAVVEGRLEVGLPAELWLTALEGAERRPLGAQRGRLHRGLGHPSAEVAERCAEVLGAIGGREDVEPLQEVSRRLRRDAERAIAAIQSRLGDVEAGRLTVVADDRRGALSEPAVPVGALSEARVGDADDGGTRPPPPRVTR